MRLLPLLTSCNTSVCNVSNQQCDSLHFQKRTFILCLVLISSSVLCIAVSFTNTIPTRSKIAAEYIQCRSCRKWEGTTDLLFCYRVSVDEVLYLCNMSNSTHWDYRPFYSDLESVDIRSSTSLCDLHLPIIVTDLRSLYPSISPLILNIAHCFNRLFLLVWSWLSESEQWSSSAHQSWSFSHAFISWGASQKSGFPLSPWSQQGHTCFYFMSVRLL